MNDDQTSPQDPKMSADDLWNTAAGFGVTPAHVKMMLAPLVQEIMGESLKEIPEQIKQMITHQTDQMASEIVDKVKAAFGGGIGGNSNGNGTGEGVHPLAAALLTAVTNKVMGPPAGVAPAGAVQGITDFANTMSTLWGNVLEPVLGIYGQGARDERARLTDLTKMGYEVNIGGPVSPPVADKPTPAGPAAPVANMRQPETMKQAARRVAEAIKVGG